MAALIPFRRNNNLLNSDFEDFYNIVDDFWGDSWLKRRNPYHNMFKVDVMEGEKEYMIEAEVAGVNKDDIDISLADSRLVISINQQKNVDEERKNYIHRERQIYSLSRSVYLPDAESGSIKAKIENGVLFIKVPKEEKNAKTQRIEIE